MKWSWEKRYLAQMNEIIQYSKLIYNRGLVGAAGGNVSTRCGDAVLITGSDVPLRSVAPDGLVLCNLEGEVLDGNPHLRPSKEIKLHLNVYHARPEVNYVIHVHPCYATTWSMMGQDLPLYTESARLKLGHVPCIPQADPGSAKLAENVLTAVSRTAPGSRAYLLEAHGVLVFGSAMEECFDTAELLEDSAKIAVLKKILK